MSVPFVVARPQEVAERMLREAGVAVIEVARTQPPRGGPDGPVRVIRQRVTPHGVQIVVAASAPLPETEASHD